MSYPTVKYFLTHITTGTKVLIEDDIIEGHVYFKGNVKKYFESSISLENLTLIQSFIKDNVLNVRAIKDYEQN